MVTEKRIYGEITVPHIALGTGTASPGELLAFAGLDSGRLRYSSNYWKRPDAGFLLDNCWLPRVVIE